jgi:hypothetical protein
MTVHALVRDSHDYSRPPDTRDALLCRRPDAAVTGAETIRTGRERVSQMEHEPATEGGAFYTSLMAGYQDELTGIRAVRGRATDVPQDSPDPL